MYISLFKRHPTFPSKALQRRSQVLLFVGLSVTAQAQELSKKEFDNLFCAAMPGGCKKQNSKSINQATPTTPVYIETSSSVVFTPIPRYATNVDDRAMVSDCVISGMKGVGNDSAARMIKNACENKALSMQRDKDVRFSEEYGSTVSNAAVEVVPFRKSGSAGDRLQIANVGGRSDAVVTYLGVNVTSKNSSGACEGLSMRFAYKLALSSKNSADLQIPAFYPAESPGVCVAVVSVKAKPFSWTDSWKSLATFGEISPLKEDPFP